MFSFTYPRFLCFKQFPFISSHDMIEHSVNTTVNNKFQSVVLAFSEAILDYTVCSRVSVDCVCTATSDRETSSVLQDWRILG